MSLEALPGKKAINQEESTPRLGRPLLWGGEAWGRHREDSGVFQVLSQAELCSPTDPRTPTKNEPLVLA